MALGLTDKHAALATLLTQLQACLQAEQLWASEPPSQQALNSTQPFCVDTLSFEQWLQFVMMPRFQQMIQTATPLPTQCDISPMAQEAFKSPSLSSVMVVIRAIDKLLSGPQL